MLQGAKGRGSPPDHILLAGPPGLGKTTLSMIIANELGMPIRITSGPAIQHAGDLAAILSSLTEGEVLFLDEIHRMSRPAEEMLYMAMEDFRVDVIVGKGPGATAIPLELPPFTLVGATTRSGLLPAPLRDRFGFTAHMEFYEPADLERVVHRSSRLLDIDVDAEAAAEIASAPGALRVSRTGCCAGFATSRRSRGTAGARSRRRAARLAVYEVDERGLDRLDRAVLGALLNLSRADRSACPRWPWRSARRPTPSRRWPSPSWSGRACSRAPRAAGSLPPRPGGTWACRCRAPPPAPARRRCSRNLDSRSLTFPPARPAGVS